MVATGECMSFLCIATIATFWGLHAPKTIFVAYSYRHSAKYTTPSSTWHSLHCFDRSALHSLDTNVYFVFDDANSGCVKTRNACELFCHHKKSKSGHVRIIAYECELEILAIACTKFFHVSSSYL